MWKAQTWKRETLWCTLIVFYQSDGQCFMLTIIVHQAKEYFQDLHLNIPLEWIIHHTPYSYMDIYGCIKSTTELLTVQGYSTISNQILFFVAHAMHFNDRSLSYMKDQYIQPFVLKSVKSVNDHFNVNGTNVKLKFPYTVSKLFFMMKYRREKFLPYHINSILVKVWDAFNLSSWNIIRDVILITNVLPFSLTSFATNTQKCVASVQVSSV